MGLVPGLRRDTALEGDGGSRVLCVPGLCLPVTAGRLVDRACQQVNTGAGLRTRSGVLRDLPCTVRGPVRPLDLELKVNSHHRRAGGAWAGCDHVKRPKGVVLGVLPLAGLGRGRGRKGARAGSCPDCAQTNRSSQKPAQRRDLSVIWGPSG